MIRAKLFCFVSCALAFGAFMLPGDALAQNCACGQRVVVQPSYSAPVTYVAPVVQHAPYVPQQALREVFYIPTPQLVQARTDYSFTVRDEDYEKNRDALLVDAIVGRIMQLQQKQAVPLQQNPPAPSASIPSGSVPLVAAPQASKKGAPVGHVPSAAVTKIFADRCNRCHGDNGIVRAGLNLTNPASLTLEDWAACHSTCAAQDMPKDDRPLSSEELTALFAEYKAAKKK
jgi:mono/diheme cytochrome c family protein